MRKRTLLVAAAFALAACGAEEARLAEPEATSTTGEPTTSTTAATTTAAPPKVTTTTAAAAPSSAECVDPTDDAGGTSADLTKVTLVRSGESLKVTYDLAADVAVPPDGASWIIVASRGAGNDFKQFHLGLKIVGQEVTRFIFDFSTSRQTNLRSAYTATGRQVTATFPTDVLPTPFAWRAVTTSSGADVDRCPGEGTLTFAG